MATVKELFVPESRVQSALVEADALPSVDITKVGMPSPLPEWYIPHNVYWYGSVLLQGCFTSVSLGASEGFIYTGLQGRGDKIWRRQFVCFRNHQGLLVA